MLRGGEALRGRPVTACELCVHVRVGVAGSVGAL
jgi:hypothetical protein